jgi:translation initiation factor IF-1
METLNPAVPVPNQRRTLKQLFLSYFYWTYPRGSFHYDIMVTMILLFIFVTPFLWSYGDKPSPIAGPLHPIQVVANDGHGLIVTVQADDANVPAGASEKVVKQALRKAIEPVTGDTVFVERWETVTDAQGNVAWRVWAHR